MTHHKGTVSVCQYPPDPDARENTPPPPNPPPALDSTDRRLVLRYGAWLLTGGYTAIPTYAWVYYARLGVSEAEMVCICQLCTYWWGERAPYPGEAALAARMGKTVRTIQGYLRSLEGKGFLHIETRLSKNGQRRTNAYDLRPFFAAVVGLARLDGLLPDRATTDDTTPAAPRSSPHACGPRDPTNAASAGAERESLCAGTRGCGPDNRPKHAGTATTAEGDGSRAGGAKNLSPQVDPIEIETFDSDSIPPTPTYPANARFRKTGGNDAGTEGPQLRDEVPQDADDQALAAEVAALSDELGDDAPRSSLGRARNLHRDAGVSLARFLRLLDEAAARTRDRQASIVKRRRDDQAPNGMPYLFAVLTDLLHPVPPRVTDGSPDAERRRGGGGGAAPPPPRRRRDEGYGEPASSYAAWSDSPAPLPIVEEHPVWRAVLAELAQVLTPENFNAWLASTRALDQDGAVLRVAVPAAFNKTWLEQKLAGKVAGALRTIDDTALHTGRVLRVEYVVEPAACGGPSADVRAS